MREPSRSIVYDGTWLSPLPGRTSTIDGDLVLILEILPYVLLEHCQNLAVFQPEFGSDVGADAIGPIDPRLTERPRQLLDSKQQLPAIDESAAQSLDLDLVLLGLLHCLSQPGIVVGLLVLVLPFPDGGEHFLIGGDLVRIDCRVGKR